MPRSKGHDISAHKTRAGRLRHLEREYAEVEAETVTDVEEVWFAGCHCGTWLLLLFERYFKKILYYTYIRRCRRWFSRQQNS